MFDFTVSPSIRLLDSVFVALDAARVEQERRGLLHGGLQRHICAHLGAPEQISPSVLPQRELTSYI